MINWHAYAMTMMWYFLTLGGMFYVLAVRITWDNVKRQLFPVVSLRITEPGRAGWIPDPGDRWMYS